MDTFHIRLDPDQNLTAPLTCIVRPSAAAITLPAASTFTFTRTTTSPVIDRLILSDTIGANCRMALGGVKGRLTSTGAGL